MLVTQLTLIITYMISTGQFQMEPFIIDGSNATISRFPYSANLYIRCAKESGDISAHMCGSSIVNQYVTLTAAHCTSKCVARLSFVVYVGHETWRLGATSTSDRYQEHAFFDRDLLTNDIALVRLKTPLTFSENVKRVALMNNPPYNAKAHVAGWGRYSREHRHISKNLQYAVLTVDRGQKCPRRFEGDGYGTLCAVSKCGHVAKGDSGSALVVDDYIQIGIVSFAYMKGGNRTVFFTDTGFFFKWIKENTKIILCSNGGPGEVDADEEEEEC